MPWPYCVILTAVQSNCGRAAISPATTLVLPTFRECPPITIRATSVLLRQARDSGQLLQILAKRLRGRSPEGDAFAAQNLVGQDSALTADHNAFANRSVLADANLSAEDDTVFDGDAARESGLRGDDDVFADLAVVADV